MRVVIRLRQARPLEDDSRVISDRREYECESLETFEDGGVVLFQEARPFKTFDPDEIDHFVWYNDPPEKPVHIPSSPVGSKSSAQYGSGGLAI